MGVNSGFEVWSINHSFNGLKKTTVKKRGMATKNMKKSMNNSLFNIVWSLFLIFDLYVIINFIMPVVYLKALVA
jgi:hypothetical protein